MVAAGIELLDGEYERKLVATDPGATAELPGGNGLVVLDTDVTEDLAAEGVARDVVRAVQQARRDAGLDVSDRITRDAARPTTRWPTRSARTRTSCGPRRWPTP